MQEIFDQLRAVGLEFGMKLLAALAIFFIGRYLIGLVVRVASSVLRRSPIDETLHLFVERLIYFGLLTFVAISALGQLGIQTHSFVAVLGAAAFAIGLAFKDSLSNLSAGVMIIVFRPFNVGDYVEICGMSGTVRTIDVFSTGIASQDNKWINIPNSKVVSDTITNVSRLSTRRIDMIIGIGYGDDIRTAKNLLEELLLTNPLVLKEPAPLIAVYALGESSVDLAIRPWVKTSDYWPVRFWFLEAAKERLEQAGITIPYPQREVRVISETKAT